MALFKFEDKLLKKARKQAELVEKLKPTFTELTDEQLVAKTDEYRERYKKGETLDDLLPEVFAQVREASRRVLGMEHFKVQIIGGIVLHNGDIAEMKTGEGKTLVATLPVCLNAITGEGVHVVTVNDYLAKRDSEWMGILYRFLGFTVGLALKDMSPEEKREAYNCDIVYATNNELGFDYLRDNMVVYKERLVQRELNYAIVDEVDSILIDEARTPLIISGAGDKSTDLYKVADSFARGLKEEEDYVIDEKAKTANLTEEGTAKAEKFFDVENFSDVEHTDLNHHVYQALKARYIIKRDIDYVVQNGEVIIVDEFTGRLMTGRRYSDGLHQAIEAKENVRIASESQTLATITFQNFFRMYKKLAGMTGTAKTEENEFKSIYNLSVVEIPTHRPMVRKDMNDVVLSTVKGKFDAVVEKIVEVHQTGQPILVGTVSVENSEILSKMLKKRGVKHEVLNAKHHEKEAQIVAQAGQFGAVTIATNMAGRGTDILLGGNPDFMAKRDMRADGYSEDMIYEAQSKAPSSNPEVLAAREVYNSLLSKHKQVTDADHEKVIAAGGLYIIGTERHESRRIDNQLRGRSGRQGDPGASQFYIALEDDLMRLFGGERIKNMLDKISGGEEMPLEYGMMTNQIEKAQKRIEERNFNTRSNVLKYDDVMNMQREVIYSQRRQVLMGEDVTDAVRDVVVQVAEDMLNEHCPEGSFPEEWEQDKINRAMKEIAPELKGSIFGDTDISAIDAKKAKETAVENLLALYDAHSLELAEQCEKARVESGAEQGLTIKDIERNILLRCVDQHWVDHIDAMDQLRQGIGLRAYGNMDPVVAYRKEGADMFDAMIASIAEQTVKMMFRVTVKSRVERKQTVTPLRTSSAGDEAAQRSEKKTVQRKEEKVGRNDPCPCGSGKKYKNCCGRN